MKRIKQASLGFRAEHSDRIFEVDLCEVGHARYVVNFHYGRRGTVLHDGSKTVVPLTLDEAGRVFDKLVTLKLNAGYEYAPVSTSAPTGSTAKTTTIADSYKQAVLGRLAKGHRSKSSWRLSRAVWRAGEMRLREAEPLLAGLLGTGNWMLDYNIAWALAQCGSEKSLPALEALQSNRSTPNTVRRMLAEASLRLQDHESRTKIIEGYIRRLPELLAQPARNGPAEEFQQALLEYLESGESQDFAVLELLYLIDNRHVRPALLHVLRNTSLRLNSFQHIRHIFKAAELRRDAEVFGLIAYRFETNISGSEPLTDPSVPADRSQPKSQNPFGRQTRLYLRRRVWRTLQRIGELGDVDYVNMAVGVLLPMTDDDALPLRRDIRYDWSQYHGDGNYAMRTVHRDRFGRYWALNQILYRSSRRYEPDRGRKNFCCVPPYEPGGEEPQEREEAFPKLWESAPERLLQLLDESRCEPVHRFAVKALRSCRSYCHELEVEALLMLLHAGYAGTVELGFELAVAQYDTNHLDPELVLTLANCGLERARAQAHHWIDTQRSTLFADTDFIVDFVSSPYADTRSFARDSLRQFSFTETAAQAVIGRLIALLQSSTSGELARDVSDTLLRVFGRRLRTIGADVIRDLFAHALAEVQQFAGDLLLNHETLAKPPPEDLLRAMLNAKHAAVRGIGVRFIEQLPDDVLKRSVELLVVLSRHPATDIREAIRPAVMRLTASDREFGRHMADMLVQAILTPGAPQGVPSHTSRILREDLREHLAHIPSKTIWKLLQSRSMPAQELGEFLLETNVQAEDFSVMEIAKLANHESLSVREFSWKMCTENLDCLQAAVARILDAKWDDSRQFAFRLFRENFSNGELTPEILVGICDSVRPDVQQFGREMISQLFEEEHGPEYLIKLSEHPAPALQLFATNFLEQSATDNIPRLRELTPFFISVLSRINKGRVAKDRVSAFLEREALKSEVAATIVAEILTRISATSAVGEKASAIEIMVKIHAAYPALPMPLQFQAVEVRHGV